MPLALLIADPLAGTLLLLALLWLAAKVGGEWALRLGLPPVTGELVAGVGLTLLHRLLPGMPEVATSPSADLLGGLGVVVLMFAVGLESTVPQMLKVGAASLRVAVVGVVLPMVAGLAGSWLLLPKGTPFLAALFIGACLCATSIGLSAQVLKGQGALDSQEGRIILGAAVLDDVLGLLVLVGVSGLVAEGEAPGLGATLGSALGFLVVALTLGRAATPPLFRLATRLRGEQVLLPAGLGFAFLLAWLGNRAGLAPIVGAYAAGLILEPAHVEDLARRERHSLEALVHPLVVALSPLFFVLMGARVDPGALLRPRTLLLALGLAALGVLSKVAAGWAAGRGVRAAVIGWGMVPRGEVGLIFVAAGTQLHLGGAPLLGTEAQAGVILALLFTTLAGPMGLASALKRPANK